MFYAMSTDVIVVKSTAHVLVVGVLAPEAIRSSVLNSWEPFRPRSLHASRKKLRFSWGEREKLQLAECDDDRLRGSPRNNFHSIRSNGRATIAAPDGKLIDPLPSLQLAIQSRPSRPSKQLLFSQLKRATLLPFTSAYFTEKRAPPNFLRRGATERQCTHALTILLLAGVFKTVGSLTLQANGLLILFIFLIRSGRTPCTNL